MKVSVRGSIFDLLAFRGLPGQRRKRFSRAAAGPLSVHAVNRLAGRIHPSQLELVITGVRDETKSTRTFRLACAPGAALQQLPVFRAGQYLSLKACVDGARITRPYSISSAPYEALGEDGYYEITMRRVEDGFLTDHAWANWDVGFLLSTSPPVGTFYHEPLRDGERVVGLAGGTGITPFRSMAREIVGGSLGVRLLLLYGSSDEADMLFYEELKQLEAQSEGRVRVVHVLSCDDVILEGCEQGFITSDIIRRYADPSADSFFICGPQVMYEFLKGQLEQLDLPGRRVRWEVYGERKDISLLPGFPSAAAGLSYEMTIRQNGDVYRVSARGSESLLVAMERAGIVAPSQCRSGECGFCRSRLVSGEVYVVPDSDGRRAADLVYGFIHPCSSYPLSDVEVQVPPAG
jgi:ferredoxin-NADP reductase